MTISYVVSHPRLRIEHKFYKNKMKVIVILILSLHYLYCGEYDDNQKYQAAYEYVVSSADVQQNVNELYKDSTLIYVSDQVLSFCYWPFEEQVVEYKYAGISDSTRSLLIDELGVLPSSEPLDKKREYLSTLNKNQIFNRLLFFSVINHNWLSAELFNYDNRSTKDYFDATKMPQNVLHILFYFEKNSVKKVFLAKGSRY